MSNQTNLRWNLSEFEVSYECLRPLYKVGKYFLRKLLVLDDEPTVELRKSPSLRVHIDQPVGFMDELISRFISSDDPDEHEVIVMTLCVLYRKQFDKIGSLKSLPFWLKLVHAGENPNCHFLML